MNSEFLKNDYLKEHIIAYIGNKRRLLPLIYDALQSLYGDSLYGKKFVDLFAGSGSVSRLARLAGCEIFSNDWEVYSFALSSCYLGMQPSDIEDLYGSQKLFLLELEHMNNLDFSRSKPYISRFYAPDKQAEENGDFRGQRLFYSRENALRIDSFRQYIQENYEQEPQGLDNLSKRALLLGVLLYKAATHTNTSGVFKSYYKDFGGFNNDALSRILKTIEMEAPYLCSSDFKSHIYREDANSLIKRDCVKDADILYLDPPYNQHQYGSNYHLLNTIALWDNFDAGLEINGAGELVEKAGIRRDWRKTRSTYCYTDSAVKSFAELIEHADARHIIISYSTDGIIPFDTFLEICKSKGNVRIFSNQYTTCRGGRQSNIRKNNNVEFLIIIETGCVVDPGSEYEVKRHLARRRLELLKKDLVKPELLQNDFSKIDESIFALELADVTMILEMENLVNIGAISFSREPELEEYDFFEKKIAGIMCGDRKDELDVLVAAGVATGDKVYIKKIPRVLRKLNHSKYGGIFTAEFNRLSALAQSNKAFASLQKSLDSIARVAQRRNSFRD